jgi:rhodanese-related sulfurtransferase
MSHTDCAAILDIRTEQRFAAGHAAGAANIPLEELARRAHELPRKGSAVRLFDDDTDRLREAAAFEGYEPLVVRDGLERDGRAFSQLLARRRT